MDERRRSSHTVTAVVPAAVEVERAVLSIMMQFKGQRAQCVDSLSEEDFYSDRHQVLFEALVGMSNRSEQVDLPLITERLLAEGTLERAGGASYLSELAIHEASPHAVEDYVRVLREKTLIRSVKQIGRRLDEQGAAPGTDAEAYAELAEQLIFDAVKSKGRRVAIRLGESLQQVVDRVGHLYEHCGDLTGVPSGFYDLDHILFGYQPSDLIILAARPAMGKTSLALNSILHGALQGRRTAFFSLEMPHEQLSMRVVSTASGISLKRIRRGALDEEEWAALVAKAGELSDLPLYIDDSAGLSVSGLTSRARRMKAEHGLDMIFIDYLQLMRGSSRAASREQEISEISRSLKGLAKELEVPVMALSQLNRGLESRQDKRPMLSDLRESGAIEQDADVVMFLFRDEVYTKDECTCPGIAELIVAKHRNGETGTVTLGFEGALTRFNNLVRDHDALPDRGAPTQAPATGIPEKSRSSGRCARWSGTTRTPTSGLRRVRPAQLGGASRRIAELAHGLSEGRRGLEAGLQDPGEACHLVVVELQGLRRAGSSGLALLSQPLDDRVDELSDLVPVARHDDAPLGGLMDDPGGQRADLAQQVRALVGAERHLLLERVELVLEYGVDLGLEAGHEVTPCSRGE